jgi:hypothetical protein
MKDNESEPPAKFPTPRNCETLLLTVAFSHKDFGQFIAQSCITSTLVSAERGKYIPGRKNSEGKDPEHIKRTASKG